ncbi:MAG: twin-arginine translocase subunit TatB [Acidobacteria bacterium]|nr:twin-arginine translocase subunit TatB [Acidobacteriota bacterium]MBP7474023.1 twin-arginine translocase subunit TatB [Pyrinomonadaceae bacterium]MBP9109928.1 twin-arginine translocase subunit TatB [Pyrinomonadaceae bacterium]
MFLFILESIGTSELILIGIVALMFLGPRRLPEIAKKAGKIMSEFRGTANEFKQTWQQEVDFEEEKKALDLNTIEAEAQPVVRTGNPNQETIAELSAAPAVVEVDAETIKERMGIDRPIFDEKSIESPAEQTTPDVNDKRNWL